MLLPASRSEWTTWLACVITDVVHEAFNVIFCLLQKDKATNEEPLKQELSAAVEDNDESEGQDLMSMGLDDTDLAEETQNGDKNLMEQGDDENSEDQSDLTAQCITFLKILPHVASY